VLARVVNPDSEELLTQISPVAFQRPDGTREKTGHALAVFLLARIVRGGVKEESEP
jgi:hypothetical protein